MTTFCGVVIHEYSGQQNSNITKLENKS